MDFAIEVVLVSVVFIFLIMALLDVMVNVVRIILSKVESKEASGGD